MLPAPQFVRRTTSVLDEFIQGIPSFEHTLLRADRLELGHGDSSSAESISNYFLRKPQDSIKARLLQHQGLHHRIGFRTFMDLLWFSSHCSFQTSLLCGSLFKVILDAKLSIVRVQEILEAPSRHSQVGDLLLTLADLKNLFSKHVLDRIRHEKDLLKELDGELKRYLDRMRVRALSRASRCRDVVHDLKAGIRRRFGMCTASSDTDEDEPSKRQRSGGDIDDDAADVDVTISAAVADSSSLKPEDQRADFISFSALHKVHVRLHELQKCMLSVSFMLDTLKLLVVGTHNQTLNEHLIERLRDEPLMFEGVAEQITDCHILLSKHLDDLREQVLICFCFINRARDQICPI